MRGKRWALPSVRLGVLLAVLAGTATGQERAVVCPANQIVVVEAREGFASEGLFTPVWVEGTLSTAAATRDLTFVDGSAPIESGYSMQATSVQPYQ